MSCTAIAFPTSNLLPSFGWIDLAALHQPALDPNEAPELFRADTKFGGVRQGPDPDLPYRFRDLGESRSNQEFEKIGRGIGTKPTG